MTRTLSRSEDGRPAAPIRILHLGIGNFTRAHQAWYTEHAADADEWGIAGYAGRTTTEPRNSPRDDALDAQGGCYLVAIQEPQGDRVEVISSVSKSFRSHDSESWLTLFRDPAVVIVTSTITEAGYCRNAEGDLDLEQVADDLETLKAGRIDDAVFTGPAKFVRGLLARREADAGPITFVPCDNIPDNGAMSERIITQAATYVDPSLTEWMRENVSFVSSMVDRITPRATDDDIDRVARETGIKDPGLVVTEPFAEWVLSGEFKAGRPRWESAGAAFVNDIGPYERRKLYLLNGSHSLMAYCASILGHETVVDAINDERVLGWVNEFWDEASQLVTLPEPDKQAYRQALLERYRNPRIRHLLGQIAADGTQKVPIRHAPTLKAFAERGEVATGTARAVAGWVLHLRGVGAAVDDAGAAELAELVSGDLPQACANVLKWLGIPEGNVREAVVELAQELDALA